MQSKLLISTALFSALTLAQTNDYNINYAEEMRVKDDALNLLSTVQADPAFQTDLAALLPVVPSSIVALAQTNPAALVNQIVGATTPPAWVANIPTPVLDSLATLYAKPVKAIADVNLLFASVLLEPSAASVISVLMTNVPTSVQKAYEANSLSFIVNFATATPLPAWASNVPKPIQRDIGSIINSALSIIEDDLTASAPAPTSPQSGFMPSAASAYPTGTGSFAVFNPSATGSPIAFTGAAAPMKTAAAVGAAALAGAAGVLLNF